MNVIVGIIVRLIAYKIIMEMIYRYLENKYGHMAEEQYA